MKIKSAFIFVFLLICGQAIAQDSASLLPNAKQTFVDQNGNPYNGGKVYFYIPGTDTFKNTWQDGDKGVLNSNPVILDAAGRAIIYGDGEYRQVLRDRNNNLIWDQLTSSTGTGGGSSSTGDGDLVGTVKPWAGLSAPNQYLFAYGQEIARSTYPELFTAITLSTSAFCTNGSPNLTGIADTTQIPIGAAVEASCISSGSTVLSKTSSSITVTNNAIISTSLTIRVLPWGGGNGTTTFNLPDFRGRIIAGRDNMGGTAASRLTATYFANANAIGAAGGLQSSTLTTANLASHNHAQTAQNPTFTYTKTTRSDYSATGGEDAVETLTIAPTGQSTTLTTASDATPGNTANAGSGTAFSNVQPTITSNYIIKVTPDANSGLATGVLSLGGMTGVIGCGVGLTCTGNIISLGDAGSISGNDVTFIQDSVNAVPRTMMSKARDIINARDFGVVCDGTTDDTANINNSIVYANSLPNGAEVILPSGICLVSETSTFDAAIFLLNNVSLRGQGIDVTTIKIADNQASVHVISTGGTTFGTAHNVGIYNLTVDGNRRGNSNGIAIRVGQEGVDDMQVNTVAIRNSGSYAIGLQSEGTDGQAIKSFKGINIIMDDCGNDCLDSKNESSANIDNILDNISILYADEPGFVGGGSSRLDLRGPWIVSNLFIYCAGGTDIQSAVQFGSGDSASPNGEGAHKSSLTNFYISSCDPTNTLAAISVAANNVNISNGYIEGTKWGIRIGVNIFGTINTNINNINMSEVITAGVQTTKNASNITVNGIKVIKTAGIVASSAGVEIGEDDPATNVVISNSYFSGYQRGIRVGTNATNTTLIGNNFGTNSFNISDPGGVNTRGFYNNGAELPLKLLGTTSGVISITPQAAAGTYNFNLPISAGTAGQPLLSGGGGATAMTFGTLGVAGGGTNCSVASGTCLDNISGFSSTGFITRTGVGTYAFRSIFGTTNEITVTNGGGSSGNPIIGLSSNPIISGAIKTSGFTVGNLNSTLPCSGSTVGYRAYVTDASGPTFLATLSGGGGNTVPAFCDGSNWVAG